MEQDVLQRTARDLPIPFGDLALFELPRRFVEPAMQWCRFFNTTLDYLYYDVPALRAALKQRDAPMEARGEKPPSRIADANAFVDPEGSLLLIDAAKAPYVHVYHSVEKFLASPYRETRDVDIATITGVGSSALGSAAFAWDISAALGKPVLGIVPGYGVADAFVQALGGWLAFGLHDFLATKSRVQDALAVAAPDVARVGRRLASSAPDAPKTRQGAPLFRHGSGSSDVLHSLLRLRETPFRLLVGHSKGALQVDNALQSLPPERTHGLHVVTLGCAVERTVPGVAYHQFLGLFDWLGRANSWEHAPDEWPPTGHGTDRSLPLAMDAGALTRKAALAR